MTAISESILQSMTASYITSSSLLTASGERGEIRNYHIDRLSICRMSVASDIIVGALPDAEDMPDAIIGMDIISRLNIEIREYREHMEVLVSKGTKRAEDALILHPGSSDPVVYKDGKLIL